jgi:hypothetical protein
MTLKYIFCLLSCGLIFTASAAFDDSGYDNTNDLAKKFEKIFNAKQAKKTENTK